MSVEPGQSILQYRLTRKIGEGGMGEVWLASDTSLDRDVAIKVLPEGFDADSERLARFEREAKAVAALSHPNILAIHDFGVHEGRAYAVMELLDGESLRERLSQGVIPSHRILDYSRQIARGLAAAHERGVVHRDLKPENMFVTRDGLVKILDFGLAKVNSPDTGGNLDATPTRTNLTEPGKLLGTVGYMSPEQVRGQAADNRSDIFSFGVVLYEMLANRRPFERETAAEIMTAILREEPAELDDHDPAIVRVVQHCLEKRLEERFQSARDLVFALEPGTGQSHPSRASIAKAGMATRSPKPLVTAAIVLAALALGVVAGLFAARALQQESTSQPTFKQLTFARGRIDNARFTSDGNTVIYSANWRGRPSELFSVSPGNPESLALGLETAILLGVSSSGELAINRDTRLSSGSLVGTLARLPLGSTAPRDVLERVLGADWAPGGDRIALLRVENYQRFVESPPGKVWLQTDKFANFLRVAPVGDDVAIWRRENIGSGLGEILVLSPGGDSRAVTECFCTGLSWSPKGDEIWFSEMLASGETTFSAVTTSGKRREIRRIAGLFVIQDIADDGTVLVTSRSRQSGVLGLLPGSDEERDLSWFDGTLAADLSDDGRLLLFNEDGPGGGPNGSFFLRDLASDTPAVRLGDGFAVDLSPDGRFALAYVSGVSGQYKIIPTGAGATRTIDIGDIDSVWAWFLPGREEILINGRKPDSSWRFYTVHPDGGEPQPVTPVGVDHYRGQKAVSPDGRWVAGITDSAPYSIVRIFPMGAGEPFDLPGWEPRDIVLRWSADSGSMYVFDRDILPTEIQRIDIETGERTRVHTLMPTDSAGIRSIEQLRLTADGRYYTYTYTRDLDILYTIEGLR